MEIERIEFLKTILDIDVTNVEAMIELGVSYFDDLHDSTAAIATLEKAHALAPTSPAPLFWIAHVYYHDTAYYKKSRKYLEKALHIQPDDAASASLYGSVCCELGVASESLEPLFAASKKEPSWVSLPQQIDHVYTAMNQLSDAIEYAKKAFRLARKYREVSTTDNYSYFESGVTMRWVNKDDLFRLRYRAARRS